MIKLVGIAWVEHVACMRDEKFLQNFRWKAAGMKPHRSVGVEGWIILEWFLGKWVASCGLDYYGSGYGLVASCCEHDNELSCSLKDRKFLN
jgi:hypothetical protein